MKVNLSNKKIQILIVVLILLVALYLYFFVFNVHEGIKVKKDDTSDDIEIINNLMFEYHKQLYYSLAPETPTNQLVLLDPTPVTTIVPATTQAATPPATTPPATTPPATTPPATTPPATTLPIVSASNMFDYGAPDDEETQEEEQNIFSF